MEKILLFGNGISIRYQLSESYDSNNLKENFKKILFNICDFEQKHFIDNEDYLNFNKEYDSKIVKRYPYWEGIDEIITEEKNFNEKSIWKIYLKLVKNKLIIDKNKIMNDINIMGKNYFTEYDHKQNNYYNLKNIENLDKFIEKIIEIKLLDNLNDGKWCLEILEIIMGKDEYKIIKSNWSTLIKYHNTKNKIAHFYDYVINIFINAYNTIIKSLCYAICWDNVNNDFIKFNYNKEKENFIDKLKEYNMVFTTNYYIGEINGHNINIDCSNKICNDYICKNLKFIHGKIELNDKLKSFLEYINIKNSKSFSIINKYFNINTKEDDVIKQIIKLNSNLFLKKYGILFGENQNHKKFLNRILELGIDVEKINYSLNNEKIYELDIVGLSTEADSDMILNLLKNKLIQKFKLLKTKTKSEDYIEYRYDEYKVINLIQDKFFFQKNKYKSNSYLPDDNKLDEFIN